MRRLYDRLEEYSRQDYYGFHMPGHKRNRDFVGVDLPYELDITEIEGFDDLHHADGVLKAAQERAARVFGAEHTYFLVNGSTAGLLAGILGCLRRGDLVLMARNCHKSVYHAVRLGGFVPRYLYPAFDRDSGINGEIRREDVERALREETRIRAVVIVSPSYDGMVSDVEGIARAVHRHGIPLIVDEAHGAHFGFHPYFPQRANALGADVVVNSLHKTLPSLTQSSLLHVNGRYADRERIESFLDMLQSSSPSYLLMASLDACADLLERRGAELFDAYAERLEQLRGRLQGLTRLRLPETERYDRSKLVISTAGTDWSGKKLYDVLLEEYHLQLEMAAGTYALAMTSVADTEEGFERLESALFELDRCICVEEGRAADILPGRKRVPESGSLPRQELVYTSSEIDEKLAPAEARDVSWGESVGRIALDYAYLYPPGIPLIVPGERIGQEAAALLEYYERQGFRIEGICRKGYIRVWDRG